MENNVVHLRNEEEVISLGGIFAYILKRWKSIIIVSLLGLVLGFVYSHVDYSKELKIDRTAINMEKVDLDKMDLLKTYEDMRDELKVKIESDDVVDPEKLDSFRGIARNAYDIKKDFNWDEKAYYSKNVLGKELSKPEPSKSLKYPVLICFVALFIMCFIYAMKYIFNHTVKTASELGDMFGLHVFGVYKVSKDKKGIDGAIQKWNYKKDFVENSKEYIVNAIKEIDKMPVILVGNKNNEVITNIMKELADMCSVAYYGELQSDSNAITVANKQNGIILVVKLWNTTIDEVNREIEISIAQNINVLGCVVIR